MLYRDLTTEDLPKVRAICEDHHDFPFPAETDIVAAGVIDSNDGLVGAGIIRRIYEVIVALDLSKSKRDRVEAIKLLMHYGMIKSHRAGAKEWHVFVTDPSLIRTLKGSFGFKECKGLPLMLYFGD